MSPIRIPYGSNLRYLPLMYFLPQETIAKCPTLRILPRKVREVIYSAEMMMVVNSDQFLNEIDDSVAALAFPHLGFGGWMEHYTGFSPVWKLSYALPIWSKTLAKEISWDLQALMNIPSYREIPFFDRDYIKETMKCVVERAIKEEGWQPTLDVIREMPCDEDFMKWDTNVRKDFLRKWYHTRTKIKMISLEACMEDEEGHIHELEDVSSGFEDHAIGEDYYQRFKAQLSGKDMEILELRIEGFTYEEIARRLGYKNHSGVLKRMNAVKKRFIEYENKYGQ